MEHFPYLSNLYFGEGFHIFYERDPDQWLVEVSGIPFGLTNEMHSIGGNPWKGMLYGMTIRWWHLAPNMKRTVDKKPSTWRRFWDEFGIQEAKMIGYWNPDCPVKTDHDDIFATVYPLPIEPLQRVDAQNFLLPFQVLLCDAQERAATEIHDVYLIRTKAYVGIVEVSPTLGQLTHIVTGANHLNRVLRGDTFYLLKSFAKLNGFKMSPGSPAVFRDCHREPPSPVASLYLLP